MTQLAYSPAYAGPTAPAQPAALRRAARSLWLNLQAMGQARARRELLRHAVLRESANPELAQLLRQTARDLG